MPEDQPARVLVDILDRLVQLGGALGGSGAAGDEVEPFALDAGGQRGVHGVKLPRCS